MTLLVLLLAYVIRRRLDGANRLSTDGVWRQWFSAYTRARAGREDALLPGFIRVLVPTLLLTGLWLLALDQGLRWALSPLELVALVLLMGAPGWRQVLEAYSQAWGRGDMQAAWRHIQRWLPAAERGEALSPEAMHLSLSRTLMTSVFERFFLVVFWYVVGGLPAAFLARSLVALAEHWPQAPARVRFARMVDVIGWIPSRLLALTFGLAGDLAGWSQKIRRVLPGFRQRNHQVLMTAADGALTGYALDPSRFSGLHPQEWPDFGGRSLTAIRDLLNRSMLVWICVIALLVIAGLV
ncbi:MAG: histidine kinase [Alteromonadaceae bacterium]|nr:histidine kinase [Alteromonadaceae bacterium]